ncbi:MAG: DUF5074 domain-containing protein, partial [Dysgonomonas sp.]
SRGGPAQFAPIYADKLFVVSKQAQDTGESEKQGARFLVADPHTMKTIAALENISVNSQGVSNADGRSFVGVDEHTGYIGTSNGIYVFDFQTNQIVKKIDGSENPLVTGNEDNADGLGPLYRNQIGIMLRTSDYIFAIQQDKGILVIDPTIHEIVDTIKGCFSTMVQSMDGYIWAGKNSNMSSDGKYQAYPYGDFGASGEKWTGNQLLKLNPATLDTTIINLPVGGIGQTWYAWNSGTLAASYKTNALFFSFNSDPWSWFTTSELYKYDIDSNNTSLIYNSESEARYFYGSSVRVNPVNDVLYTTMYLDNLSQTYFFYKMSQNGEKLAEYRPIDRYWFPALLFFPDNQSPVVATINDVTFNNDTICKIGLKDIATDGDNLNAAIVKSVKSLSNPSLLDASIKNNTLTLTPLANQTGQTTVTIKVNSNGKLTETQFLATVNWNGSSIEKQKANNVTVSAKNGNVHISGITISSKIEIYTISGTLIHQQTAASEVLDISLPSNRIYVIKVGTKRFKINL